MTEPRSQRAIWFALILITVVAAVVRFSGLGDLGFFADEETTSFAARSLAEGHGAAMPSGMPYRRALPITWLSSTVVRVLGPESELAYRFVPALLGTIAIPLIFLAGRQVAGTGAGLISALLLALSGWHLVWSRTARMYAPLVTALIAFFYLVLKWKETGQSRYLAGATAIYLVGALLHRAGVAVVLFPILLATMRNGDKVSSRDAIVVAGLLGMAGLLIGDVFISQPFGEWANVVDALQTVGVQDTPGPPLALWVLGLAGGLVGCVWSIRSAVALKERSGLVLRVALAIAATLACGAAFSGLLWTAGTLALCWLIMVRVIPAEKRILPPLSVVGVTALGTLVGCTIRLAGSGWVWRSLIKTPFPYLPYLGTLLPLTILLFIGTAGGLSILRPRSGDQALRASVIFVLIYTLLIGFDVPYAPWRYLFPTYPWILLTVAAGIWWAADAAMSKYPKVSSSTVLGAISLAVIAGGIGGHGIPAALLVLDLDYGERVPWYDQGLIGRPDHKGAGLYVRNALMPGDAVVAEDPLQQMWYVGQVDYWLRSQSDAERFLHLTEDGTLRDIYVWSELMSNPPDEDWLNRQDRSVWLITSLETAGRRDLYLEEDQRQWLAELENSNTPVHVSRDGQTAVYCMGACSADPDVPNPSR